MGLIDPPQGQKPVAKPLKAKRRKANTPIEETTPAENSSLLSDLGTGGLGALHTVGSLLSTPSRMLWGTVNGLAGFEGGFGNMNPIDSTNGIELSHFLGNAGLLEKNDPNKWEWMDPVRGLVDIAGDPTSYINPLTYTTKGLQAIKAAGRVAPDAVEAAAKASAHAATQAAPEAAEAAAKASRYADEGIYRSGKEAAEHVPGNVSSYGEAPEDLFRAVDGPEINRPVLPASTAQTREEVLAAHMHPFDHLPLHEQIGMGYRGVGGVKLPFMGPLFEGLTGPAVGKFAEKTRIPQALDWLGHTKPVRALSGLFDARTRNVTHQDLQDFVIRGSERKTARAQNVMQNGLFDLEDMERLGINTPEGVAQLRMAGESVPTEYVAGGKYMDSVLDVAGRHRSELDQYGHVGEGFDQLKMRVDPATGNKFYPRQVSPEVGKSSGGFGSRAVLFEGHKMGTEGMESMLKDPKIADMIARGVAGGQEPIKTIRMINGYLKRTYGLGRRVKKQVFDPLTGEKSFKHEIVTPGPNLYAETYTKPVTGKVMSRTLNLAKYLYEHPNVGKHGVFTNHPIYDKMAYELKRINSEEDVLTGLSAAAAHIKRLGPEKLASMKGSKDAVPLKVLVKHLRMKNNGAKRFISEMSSRTGIPANKILNTPIEADFANQVKRMMTSPIQQSAVPEASHIAKSLMTMWKARTLAHPSTRARDYMSAVVQNRLMEHTTQAGNKAAADLLAGKNVAGFADDPLLAMQFRRAGYGIPEASKGIPEASKRFPDMASGGPGWKLHLATDSPEEVSKALSGMGVTHKVGHASGQSGKDVTAYIGSRADADAASARIDSSLGHLLKDPHGETLVDDMPFTKKVMGRFDTGKLDSEFHQYGFGGIPYLPEHMDPWNKVSRDVATAAAEKKLTEKYGHFFSGKEGNAGRRLSPEIETQALRATLGAGHPVNHGMIGDLPAGQLGATAEDMLQNSPGHSPRSWGKFFGDLGQLVTGHTFNTEAQAWEPSRWRDILNPGAARGAFGYEKSLNPRYALSEYLAHHGDTSTRLSGTLGQASDGMPLAEGMRRSNSALVNYDPNNFSNAERAIRSYGVPFYAFSSRMAKHTGNELLTNPGGWTAQIVKASNRASQGDPSAPDEVLAGASIPFKWPWLEDDGSKNYLSGLGLMHEDPISKFGAFLGGDIRGGMRGLAGTVGPFFKPPIEAATGKSLFNGEDLDSLDPPLGRTLANLGYMTGLYRNADGSPLESATDARPIDLRDKGYIDSTIGYSPFGRDLNTLKMLTDARPSRSIVDKALQLSTGYRTTSITPERQQKVLRARLEKAAKGLGAREISNVSFTDEQMASIRARNPQTADNLERLQAIIRQINRAKRKRKKERG